MVIIRQRTSFKEMNYLFILNSFLLQSLFLVIEPLSFSATALVEFKLNFHTRTHFNYLSHSKILFNKYKNIYLMTYSIFIHLLF